MVRRGFLIAFAAGVIFTGLYVTCGGWILAPHAQWARIIFAPGLYTASWSYDHVFAHIRNGHVEFVGPFVVGLSTMGIIAGIIGALIGLWIRKDHSANVVNR